MPRPIPLSNRLAERDRLKVAMHWYWFHVSSIRVACGSGHSTWKRASSSSQRACRRTKESSTAPGSAYRSSSSRPAWTPPSSTYARRNENVSDPPGATSSSSSCAPIGFQPCAMLPVERPATGTEGSWRPLWTPTNASRDVSKPTTSCVQPNSVTCARRSRCSVVWTIAAPARSTSTSPME